MLSMHRMRDRDEAIPSRRNANTNQGEQLSVTKVRDLERKTIDREGEEEKRVGKCGRGGDCVEGRLHHWTGYNRKKKWGKIVKG